MSKLLLVEDDESLGEMLQDRLEKEGYRVDWCKSIAESELALKKNEYDLGICDVGLPDGSGFSLALLLAGKTPFIYLTAMNSAEFRLKGFEIGAEDYIPKPFHLKELLLRVKKVLERHNVPQQIDLGGLVIDKNRRCFILPSGKNVTPTLRDYEILLLLVERRPSVVSREEILTRICKPGEELPSARTIDNSIVRLRQLLESSQDHLKSVRGVGYQWE